MGKRLIILMVIVISYCYVSVEYYHRDSSIDLIWFIGIGEVIDLGVVLYGGFWVFIIIYFIKKEILAEYLLEVLFRRARDCL